MDLNNLEMTPLEVSEHEYLQSQMASSSDAGASEPNLSTPLRQIPTDRQDGPQLIPENIFIRKNSKRLKGVGAPKKLPDSMRNPNVSQIVREYVESANQEFLQKNKQTYLTFGDDRTDKERNSYTRKLAEDALLRYVPDQYGRITFRKCYREKYKAMCDALEWLIRSDADVFDVYRQCERLRPVWKIIESRMDTALRNERRKKRRREQRTGSEPIHILQSEEMRTTSETPSNRSLSQCDNDDDMGVNTKRSSDVERPGRSERNQNVSYLVDEDPESA